MDCPINAKRMIIGGLAAGVAINVIETVAHMCVLGERYANLTKMGFYLPEPRYNFMPVWIGFCFFFGLILSWLYAASRGTFKPGPVTALKVGIMAGLLVALSATLPSLAWSSVGKLVPVVTGASLFLDCAIGTLIAGACYKPKQ